VSNLQLFGQAEDGVYLAVPHHCMRQSCENCWEAVLSRRLRATRLALNKLGVSHVWVGLVDEKQQSAVRSFKNYHSQDIPTPLRMVTSYHYASNNGLLATVNMLPSTTTLAHVELKTGLNIYREWGRQYRPKRVQADWELELKSNFNGKFTASPHEIKKIWGLMTSRYGYKPGDVPEDQEVFERRLYAVLEDIRGQSGSKSGY